jgi:hypothetical protein
VTPEAVNDAPVVNAIGASMRKSIDAAKPAAKKATTSKAAGAPAAKKAVPTGKKAPAVEQLVTKTLAAKKALAKRETARRSRAR